MFKPSFSRNSLIYSRWGEAIVKHKAIDSGSEADNPYQTANSTFVGCIAAFFFFGVTGCIPTPPPAPQEVSYTFELLPEDPPRVAVTVSLGGEGRGSTSFSLSKRWASVSDTRASIGGVRASGNGGRRLEPLEFEANTWEVYHGPDEKLSLTYELVSRRQQIGSRPQDFHRVVISDDLFHLIGRVGLLTPENLDRKRVRSIRVRWKGFRDEGWKTASSFNTGEDEYTVRTSLSGFLNSVFIAGKIRLHPFLIEGNLLQFAIYGRDWKFFDSEFVQLASEIVRYQRDFFKDHSQPYFLISLIPAGDESSGALSGTGLTDSFALFVSPRFDLEEGSDGLLRIKKLLAHELFHNWNGGKIHREEPEELVYWFSEGFTDYYARRLLRRSGLLSPEEYVDSLNELFARYMLSEVRDEPNSRIAEGFWLDERLKDLPYRRGDIVALLVDHEIRRVSSGRRDLDDLMIELLDRSQQSGFLVSTDSLLEIFADFTTPAFAARLKEIIVDGSDPEFPPDLVVPTARMRLEPMGVFDLGFDFAFSRQQSEVVSVRRGSRAYQAGLRDGQTLLGWSVWIGDVLKPVTIRVLDGATRRAITYLPQSTRTIPVPQFAHR